RHAHVRVDDDALVQDEVEDLGQIRGPGCAGELRLSSRHRSSLSWSGGYAAYRPWVSSFRTGWSSSRSFHQSRTPWTGSSTCLSRWINGSASFGWRTLAAAYPRTNPTSN